MAWQGKGMLCVNLPLKLTGKLRLRKYFWTNRNGMIHAHFKDIILCLGRAWRSG
jgi:hypothetical protein